MTSLTTSHSSTLPNVSTFSSCFYLVKSNHIHAYTLHTHTHTHTHGCPAPGTYPLSISPISPPSVPAFTSRRQNTHTLTHYTHTHTHTHTAVQHWGLRHPSS